MSQQRHLTTTRSRLLYVSSEIERMGTALELEKMTLHNAVRLYAQVLRQDFQYTSTDAIASVVVYLSCQMAGEPVSLGEVIEHSREEKKTVVNLSKRLNDELNLSVAPRDPDIFIEDICEEVGMTHLEDDVRTILKQGKEKNIHSGTAPNSFAAAAVYTASRIHDADVTQSEIGEAADVTEVTIRNNYQDLMDALGKLPPEVRPPQTIDEAVDLLRKRLDNLPNELWDDVTELIDTVDIDAKGRSAAGIVSGAVHHLAPEYGEEFTSEELAELSGASQTSINQYNNTFGGER